MSRIIQVLMISQIALAAGCAFKEDTGPEKPEMKPSDVIEALEKGREEQAGELAAAVRDMRLTFEEDSLPDQYVARITWPSNLKRVSLSKKDDPRERVLTNETEYSESVKGGATLSYIIKVQDSYGMSLASRELDGVAPKDRVITGRESLTDDDKWTNYNRIFFFKGGQILLNGFNLSIRAKKLYVFADEIGDKVPNSYAHILTNEPSALMKEGSGRSEGSKINIDVEQAEGHLYVHLMGTKGDSGRSGDQKIKDEKISLEIRDPKKQGAPGRPGKSRVRASPCAGTMGDVSCEPLPMCESNPTNGEPGLRGEQGVAGDTGKKGSDTGSIYFNVKEHRDFKVTVFLTPGRGGKGGEGSSTGYVGGLGGDPGAPASGCKEAVAGAEGPRGGKGPDGLEGPEGDVGEMRGNGVNLILVPYKVSLKK